MAINDIAKKLGLSKSTVSRAISGNGRVSQKTRELVLNYIAKTGYTPNAAAQNLATTKTQNIAFSMPLMQESSTAGYFFECLYGVAAVAAENSYDVIVVRDRAEQVSRIVNSRKADGLVLSSTIIGDCALEALARAEFPIVLTGSTGVPGIIQITYDARAAFRNLTLRLIDLWQGTIALLLTPRNFQVNKTRAEGFTDAFTIRNNLSPIIHWDLNDENAVCQTFKELYGQGVRNFICGDDALCATLLHLLEGGGRFGCLVPSRQEGINIAAFHSSHFLKTFHPEIPVVEMDPAKLGSFACKILIRKLKGQDVPATVLLDYEIKA
ncbi:MAG: LacI family transcriptional regulator [Clostridiales bacterium]|nr:LacI family transcriptional regulator [Clostridiales bacterium]